jgi:polyribonucleotide nucleotidyltransferase
VAELEGFKKERITAIEEFITKSQEKDNQPNPKPDQQPPQNPEPTPEQENQAQEKLAQATESDNKEDLKRVLQETSNTTQNSSDPNLKKAREEVENKLGQIDKEALRELIREEVKKVLAENQVQPEELDPTVKQKLDD